MDPALAKNLEDAGQGHLVTHWLSLPENGEERDRLLLQLRELDLARVANIFASSTRNSASVAGEAVGDIQPVGEEVCTVQGRTREQEGAWRARGLDAVAQGRLAVLLLAGGQGTRLGSSDPKGCYDIGLPSGKSLFQLQAERLLKVQLLAQAHAQDAGKTHQVVPPIAFYIMTSPFTHEATVAFFQKHAFFGLQSAQVRFFQQGSLPCFTPEGKLILESNTKLAGAPDGNGGVYSALKSSGCLADMKARGVLQVECFSVDNALVRVADPVFLGFSLDMDSPCAAKTLQKACPEERVGLFVRRQRRGVGGEPTRTCVEVVEYSEIPPHLAASTHPGTKRLLFDCSNVCMHMFSVAFLEAVADQLEAASVYHVARKNIPSKDGAVKGVKLEQFIFDVLPLASSVALFEVNRDEEFSPVKNAPGSPTDSPNTAVAQILRLHARWLVAAGGVVKPDGAGVEISPLLSYAGEGLESRCKAKVFLPLAQLS